MLAAYALPRIWPDLPQEVPSHWRGGTVTNYMPVESFVAGWLIGICLLSTLSVGLTILALAQSKWSNATRAFIAISVAASAAAASSLLAQLGVMRGLTASESAAVGAGIGILVLMGVFVAAGLIAFFALPPAQAGSDGTRESKRLPTVDARQ
ncbi:hypothetical protein [Microbacterium lushaniae]|uniref:DUF1648 domain-containing protein n=1 Tax=Microbacterium lushaniae TaxID=2614639 RepID=A0A5J6L3S4_9MICO|nr:hypothetical protein [Microbacterium lushaniae]QEW03025.1 hypothetical protein F6J85_07865 [Microbacterium lushaniae]